MRIYNFTDDIGVFNTNIDTESIIKDLYELRDKDTKSDGASNVSGWQKEINHMRFIMWRNITRFQFFCG